VERTVWIFVAAIALLLVATVLLALGVVY